MEKKRAVIYARFSSSKQREESIEGQLRVCNEYAARNDLLVINEYADHAISGKTDQRPAFQQMIYDSKSKSFEVLLLYNFDRFARNKEDSAIYKRELRRNGVQVISVTQPMTDQPEDIIMEALMEGLAEYYSANLSRNVKRGMTENALKGKPNGLLPLGYKNNNGEIVLDPVEANAVKTMFNLYDQGYGPKFIADEMDRLHVKSKHGNPISFQSVKSILSNPRYTGKYIYGDTVIEDGFPVLIEQELFDRVQSRIKDRRRKKRSMEETTYLLTGKLFCGHCKSPMTGESGTSKNKSTYHYYKCANAKRRKGCQKKAIRKEKIEGRVLEIIRTEILTDENISQIAERTVQMVEQENKDRSLLNAYTEELKQVTTKICNINNAIAEGVFSKSLAAMLSDLEARHDELQELIVVEQARLTIITVDDVKAWLYRMKSANFSSAQTDQALIDAFITEIFLFDSDEKSGKKQKIAIKFNTSGKAEKNGVTEYDLAECSASGDSGTPFLSNPNTRITATCLIWVESI